MLSQVFALAAGAILLALAALPARAQLPGRDVSVLTIGGAFAGYVDGDNTVSQFNTPAGVTIGLDNRLYIADRGNNRIRVLNPTDNLVETYLGEGARAARLSAPVDLIWDNANNLYVLNFNSGTVEKFNRFGNAGPAPFITGLFQPRALAIGAGLLWVGESNGRISSYDVDGDFAGSINIPGQVSGLAFITPRRLVISDATSHVLWQYDLLDNQGPFLLAGLQGIPGYQEGTGAFAQFNNPGHVAVAPNGNVVVADTGNHRVRVVACDGNTFTLYGVNPANWVGGGNPPEDFLGWRDGTALEAEARVPFGVTVDTNGVVLASEQFYHILRRVDGFDFPTNACAQIPVPPGSGTNRLAQPELNLNAGYFPAGVTVEVTNAEDFDNNTRFFYTLNGSDPTTNSASVRFVNGRAQIRVTNPTIDLSSLRIIAVNGTNISLVTAGTRRSFEGEIAGEIGVPPSLNGQWVGGQGATVILPVVANVRSDVSLRSLGYIVDATPLDNDVRVTSVQALPMGGNQRIPIVAASTNAPSAQTMTVVGNSVRLAVSYSATDSRFQVNNFGVVGMLAIQLPGNVPEGRRYRVRFGGLSGGTATEPVQLQAIGEQIIRVENREYLVADPSPAYWYNAGDFGDGRIDNNDVDAILFAVLRLRVPYSVSDLFDTMDTFFPDTPPVAGGNRQLLFSDWETAFQRFADIDQSDFLRFWFEGSRRSEGTNVSSFPIEAFSLASTSADVVWKRDATLSLGPIQTPAAGSVAQLPVYVTVTSERGIAGLLFSAAITPRPNGPVISQNVTFTPAAGIPLPSITGNGTPDAPRRNYIYLGWNNGAFAQPLTGRVLLGYLNVPVPANATGATYDVAFDYSGGAALRSGSQLADLTFQSIRGAFAIGVAQPVANILSEDWKSNFFGLTPDASADANADSDADGFSNYEEFLAGFDPTRQNARAQVANGEFILRWGGEWGRSYEVQRSSDLIKWTPAAPRFEGRNSLLEFSEGANASGPGHFYRVVRIPSAQ